MEIDKNLAGLPAKEIRGEMTRNLWGSVKSSRSVLLLTQTSYRTWPILFLSACTELFRTETDVGLKGVKKGQILFTISVKL